MRHEPTSASITYNSRESSTRHAASAASTNNDAHAVPVANGAQNLLSGNVTDNLTYTFSCAAVRFLTFFGKCRVMLAENIEKYTLPRVLQQACRRR